MQEIHADGGELRRNVAKLMQDMYFGNGKPALTLRTAALEKDVADMKDTVEQIRGDIRKVVWFVLAAVIGEVLKLIFVKGL